MATFNLLFLGDIVGEPGRRAVIELLPTIREREGIDFVIVNGENSANGRGITPKISIDLLRAGAAVITTGDHVWDQKEVFAYIDTEPRLLRPLNYPRGHAGAGERGARNRPGQGGRHQRAGDGPSPSPAWKTPSAPWTRRSARMREETPIIFVDMHAETTSEKVAMGRFLDGRVSAVVGTHTHVQTADEQVFPGGTAFLCDAGCCGPSESCLGRDYDAIIRRFLTSLPVPFPIAKGEVRLHGAIIEIDPATGHARSIRRLVERHNVPLVESSSAPAPDRAAAVNIPSAQAV